MKPSNKMRVSTYGWSNLPNDLLKVVLDQLSEHSDYIRFSLACKPWLSVAQSHQNQWLKSQPPILLIPSPKSTITYTIHNIAGKKLLLHKGKLHVPIDINRMNFRGSSHGWLIFLHCTSAVILINPFTNTTIHLPLIIRTEEESNELFNSWDFKLLRIKKFVLSEDPSLHPDTYQVLALYGFDRVLLFRSGSENWVHVELEIKHHLNLRNLKYWVHPILGGSFKDINEDAIYYQGKFYITGKRWFVTVGSDAHVNFRHLVIQQDRDSDQWHSDKQYLVESCNGCLLYIEKSTCSKFRVYKVNPNDHDGSMTCSEVRNLGGGTLFIGFRSFSILASEFSRYRPEFIYYADSIYDKDDKLLTPDKYTEDTSIVYDIRCGRAKCNKLGVRQLIDQVESPFWIVPRANLNISFVAD